MSAKNLNSSPFRQGQRGELATLDCAVAQIALQGAHVLSWQPPGARSVLFLSPKSAFRSDVPIRGGVPLCFPWFGPSAGDRAAPQHGFARTRMWKVDATCCEANGVVEARLQLSDDAGTRAWWPHAFVAAMIVRSGQELDLTLEVRNTGSEPFTFGAALHTYFCVSDVRRIEIGGLENTRFLDKVDGAREKREGAAPLRITGETDRIYLDTTAACTIDDPGWSRRIVIEKQGSRSTVVWNPWIDKARAMADLGDDDWPHFVCVETCNAADDVVSLAPGESHRLSAEIAIES